MRGLMLAGVLSLLIWAGVIWAALRVGCDRCECPVPGHYTLLDPEDLHVR